MAKKNKKKRRRKIGSWTPPKGAKRYFYAASDRQFKKKYPVGYGFLEVFGIVALLLPVVLYLFLILPVAPNDPWIIAGLVGTFLVGIGFFNFVAIIIGQYLGHLVSIISFIIGGMLIWVSLAQMGMM